MSTMPADPAVLDSLVNDFGGNYVFALDVLEQYKEDRKAVDASWREYFDRIFGAPPEPERPAQPARATTVVTDAVPAARALVRQDGPAMPAPARSKAPAARG